MDDFKALWLEISINTEVSWVSIATLVTSIALGIITLRILWLNLNEMKKTRIQIHSPLLEITTADVLIRASDDCGHQKFHIMLGCLINQEKGQLPKVVNLGGGIASQIRIKITPANVHRQAEQINQHTEVFKFEMGKNSGGDARYEGFEGPVEDCKLRYSYLKTQTKTRFYNFLMPEDKAESKLEIDKVRFIQDAALALWLEHLKIDYNFLQRRQFLSDSNIEVRYMRVDGVEDVVMFRPILELITQATYNYPPDNLTRTVDYYCSVSFRKI